MDLHSLKDVKYCTNNDNYYVHGVDAIIVLFVLFMFVAIVQQIRGCNSGTIGNYRGSGDTVG